MWADEFDAWNLLVDPSWRHAFQSLNKGADGGPPFFYAIGRIIFAVTGAHPVVMRLYSAFCFWLAAVIWADILRRYFGWVIALSAIVVGFLCNAELVDQMAQVRFYGELVLATALAVRIALWLEEKQPRVLVWFALSALSGLFMVASHPLGLVYNAVILFAQMLSKTGPRERAAAVAGTVLSWSYLLIFFAPVEHANAMVSWLVMPTAAGVVHFYNNHPMMFPQARYGSVLLNVGLVVLALYACFSFVRSRRWKSARPDSFVLLFYISVGLMLMPIAFGVVSHLFKPMFLGRYMLPYTLGLITLAANGTWLLAGRAVERFPGRAAVLAGIPLLMIVYANIAVQRQDSVSSLDSVLQLSRSMPTVMQDDETVRQAHFYAPQRANNLYYLLPEPKPGHEGTLNSIFLSGYEPALVNDESFFAQHPRFLYVDGPWPRWIFDADRRDNPQWNSRVVGTVTLHGAPYPVLEFTRVDSSPPAELSSR